MGTESESKAAWLRERREGVAKAAFASTMALSAPADSGSTLNPSLKKEESFQQDKLQKRKMEALQFGHLNEDEVTTTFKKKTDKFSQEQTRGDLRGERAIKLKARKLNPTGLEDHNLRSLQIHVSSDAQFDFVMNALLRMHKESVPPAAADVFVVTSLDISDCQMQVGYKLQWAAMLIGAYMILPTYFKGRRSCLKFDAAIGYWRAVYITQQFKEHHPKMVELLEAVALRPNSKWTICQTAIEFMALRGRNKQKKSQCVVLQGKGEQVQGIHADVKPFDFKALQKSICRLDATKTVGLL